MSESQERGVARWNPFDETRLLWPDFHRRIDESFGERNRSGMIVPAIDVTETADAYVISAEVPGVKKSDLTVEVQDHNLTIRGEKKSEREDNDESARRLERSYGTFSRSFALPADADELKVSARFEDGVLRVSIAKQPEAKPKQVSIKG